MTHEMIIETLKQILKSRKMSYKALSEEIGMSESGLKKLLTAKDISLNRLTRITDVLGLSLSDLINLAHEEEIKKVSFTEKQERALSSDKLLLRVLWRMTVEEKTAVEVIQLEGITSNKLTSCLLKLENLDLIQVTKNNKVVSVHSGLYRWSSQGEFIASLNRDWSKYTLNEVFRSENKKDTLHQLSYLPMSEASKDKLFNKIKDLADEAARTSRRERMKYSRKELVPISLLVAAIPKGFLD